MEIKIFDKQIKLKNINKYKIKISERSKSKVKIIIEHFLWNEFTGMREKKSLTGYACNWQRKLLGELPCNWDSFYW